ncbi:MAG: 6-carboxyhexanoate--CoA ligase [Pelosinus sp.]|nr:6-carboxyhexanoate--CoA ligase [Pelosinus sp.]
MVYSIRMRAAQGGAHEDGGKHISGAERIVQRKCIDKTMKDMLERALSHSRGEPDFINLAIEQITDGNVKKLECLPIKNVNVDNVAEGLEQAQEALDLAGVTSAAALAGIHKLTDLSQSMRGAMILCATTGARLDHTGERGIRVSRMDSSNEQVFGEWLNAQGYHGIHIREALVLATKVVAAPGVVAELCWSDDPEYTAGYVASNKLYTRFNHLKAHGSEVGGRVFFVKENTDVDKLITFLQKQPVLVETLG